MNTFFSFDLPILATTPQVMEWVYFGIFILCAMSVYLVLVKRAETEIPRRTIDQIFFLMLGLASVIWFLSKYAPAHT
jgi:bacteriorhodopsin